MGISVTQTIMVALNAAIALAYIYIAVRIVPRFALPWPTRLMGSAFLVLCSLTHVDLAIHTLEGGHDFLVEPHMFAIHGAQAVVDWGFIVLARRHMRIKVRDDAERARAAEADRRFLAALLDSVSDGVVACDADGRVTLVNRAMRDLHGGDEAAEGRNGAGGAGGLEGAAPSPAVQESLRLALDGEALRDAEMVLWPERGPLRTVLASGQPILDGAGERLGAVVSLHDVTERTVAERALRLSEAEQRALAREQAALRRVAVAVASGAPPEAVFSLVAEEVAGMLGAEGGRVVRFLPSGDALIVGSWRAPGLPQVPAGTTVEFRGRGALSQVLRTGRAARLDQRGVAEDPMRSRLGAPIRVGSALWGAIGAASAGPAGLPRDAEARLERFADLVGMAIANADASEALRGSERRFRTLTTHAPVGIVETDRDGGSVFVNERWCQIAGLSAGEAAGAGWTRAVHPEDRDLMGGEWWRAEGFEGRRALEHRYLTPEGRVAWVDARAVALRDEGGAVTGYLVTVSDVTERRSAEALVRRQAVIMRAVIEWAPVGIALVDPGGQVVLSNPLMDEWETLRGRPPGDDVYQRALATAGQTTDPEGYRADIMALAADPARQAVDRYTLAASGRSFERYAAPVRDGAGGLLGRLIVLREVTLEDQAKRSTDEFIALASHELRTPLTSVLGYLEILMDDADGLTGEQRHFLGVIERNADRLLRLVGDLLVVARGDAGRLGLEMAAMDLGALAAECVQAARPVAEERNIRLTVEHGPLPVTGDRARLGQVVDNLLSNALKFTPAGGSVRVTAVIRGDEALLEVADDGPGIPVEEQGRLFERFYRTEQAVAGAFQGTGLGLAIAKMMVEAHGGRISVESAAGAGAAFRVRLPLRTAGEPAREQALSA